ncbi:MAG: glycosyltransferase family 2 protein [Lachnospiraceae bacterium]|nr:glycosyltransferase family 2 protein [Lachnospiraceae bacterium]
MDSLYIVVPAYNESENIEALVNDWYPIIESHDGVGESRLVIVNDGSRDDTYEKLLELAKTRPLLTPLTKPNGGHGPTLIYGYKYAIDKGADYIFQTDSDRQTLPSEFESFWKRRKKYDAVIGKRIKREDGRNRAFVEKTLCFILRMIFRVALPDANAPYRLMKRELLNKYIVRFEDDYNLPNVMLTTFFAAYHENFVFLPITFRPRQGGKNSINVKKIVAIGMKAVGDFWRFKAEIDRDRMTKLPV